MDRINALDRNLEEIEEFDNSTSRNVVEIIKLTKDSYVAIANENDRQIAMMNEKTEEPKVEENKKFESSNFELNEIKSDSVTKANDVNAKAIKETESMIDNSDVHYSSISSSIDVNEVDKEEIENVVESSFDFYNINEDDNVTETEFDSKDNVDEDSYEENVDYEEIPQETTLDNLVSSYDAVDSYEETLDDNEINSENAEVVESENNIVPEIQNYFMEHDFDGAIDVDSQETNVEYSDEKATKDLYDEISNSIDNDNITISDLNELSQKLNTVISKNKQLTSTNEELTKEKEAAVDELNDVIEQQYEAEKRRTAIIDEYNNMLNDIQHENEALEETTNKVQEEIKEVRAKTQEIKSSVSETEKYSSGIIDMLSDYGYGISNESSGKAKAA